MLRGPEFCSQEHNIKRKVKLLLYAKHLIGVILPFKDVMLVNEKEKGKSPTLMTFILHPGK